MQEPRAAWPLISLSLVSDGRYVFLFAGRSAPLTFIKRFIVNWFRI